MLVIGQYSLARCPLSDEFVDAGVVGVGVGVAVGVGVGVGVGVVGGGVGAIVVDVGVGVGASVGVRVGVGVGVGFSAVATLDKLNKRQVIRNRRPTLCGMFSMLERETLALRHPTTFHPRLCMNRKTPPVGELYGANMQ